MWINIEFCFDGCNRDQEPGRKATEAALRAYARAAGVEYEDVSDASAEWSSTELHHDDIGLDGCTDRHEWAPLGDLIRCYVMGPDVAVRGVAGLHESSHAMQMSFVACGKMAAHAWLNPDGEVVHTYDIAHAVHTLMHEFLDAAAHRGLGAEAHQALEEGLWPENPLRADFVEVDPGASSPKHWLSAFDGEAGDSLWGRFRALMLASRWVLGLDHGAPGLLEPREYEAPLAQVSELAACAWRRGDVTRAEHALLGSLIFHLRDRAHKPRVLEPLRGGL